MSQWLALISLCCLQRALRSTKKNDVVIDFGCGIGYQTEIIYRRAGKAIGVDITPGMLERARQVYGHLPIEFRQIDGIHLPVEDASVDLIWVSGVLRYSLLVPSPRHREIVEEFFRVLKPGGKVCNFEMYIDVPSAVFSKDFLDQGFVLKTVRLAHIYRSRFDKLAVGSLRRIFLRQWWACLTVWWNGHFSSENKLSRQLRDCYFEYRKCR